MKSTSPIGTVVPAKRQSRFYSPIQAVLLVIGLFFLGQTVALILALALGSRDVSTLDQATRTVAIDIVVLLALGWLMKTRGLKAADICFGVPRLRDMGYGLIGFGFYFPAILALGYLLQKSLPGLDLDGEQAIGFTNASGNELILVFISLAVLPPLLEELVCRGFLYSSLRRRISMAGSMIITSLLFAWPHLYGGKTNDLLWVAGIDTFILSIVLIKVREASGSLWASIVLHSLKNSVAFYILFIVRPL